MLFDPNSVLTEQQIQMASQIYAQLKAEHKAKTRPVVQVLMKARELASN